MGIPSSPSFSPSSFPNSANISLSQAITSTLIVFVLGMSGMFTATILKNRGYLVSLGNMFASGTLLSAAFVHTIPVSVKILSSQSSYPFSGLIVGGTFILLLIIEESIHIYTHDDHHHDPLHEPLQKSNENGDSSSSLVNYSSNCSHSHGHGHGHHGHGHGHARGSTNHNERSIPSSPLPNSRLTPSQATISISTSHTHQSHVQQHLQPSTVASIMLFVTLDVHSLFAGISVGVNLNDVTLLVALGVHKFSAAFALGATLCTVKVMKNKFLFCALFFSLMAPIGILVGAFWSHVDPTSTTMFGVCYSIVAGTFLYIGILELGMKELLICRDDPHGSGLVMDHEKGKLLALVFGFAVMALLALWL
jgi:zinc transporter ZupT